MEDTQTLGEKERAVISEVAEGKRKNCLCAPTTHAGSFRCRLHRKPPPSPVSSQLAAKRGFSAQRMSTPKLKLALHHKLKQGCSKKISLSTCSSSSRLEQELPKLSRLSRTSVANEQIQASLPDEEALTTSWKASSTADSREEVLESVQKAGDAREELSSEEKRYIRPLVKLPSI